MPKYGRFENSLVKEVAVFDTIEGRFPPIYDWRVVDDMCEEGWVDFNGVAVAPDDILPLCAKIDEAAGLARSKYITVAAGQEITYILKGQQAQAYKAANYTGPVPAMVQAEADAEGITPQAATDNILAQQDAWVIKAAQIEQARRTAKVQLPNAEDKIAFANEQIALIKAL